MIPRSGHVSDLLEGLQKKANISDELMQKVRIYEAHNSKFYKELSPDYQIMGIGDYFTLYAAPFPEEESDKKITVFHFDREPAKVHGIPFQFPLKDVRIDQAVVFVNKHLHDAGGTIQRDQAASIGLYKDQGKTIRQDQICHR